MLGFVGSGNYATAVLIPAFKESGARLKSVASAQGVSGLHAARKFGIENASTDSDAVMVDAEVNAVVITTRHNSHARFVLQALAQGKHVFVEKPLCLTLTELAAIDEAYRAKREAGDAPLVEVFCAGRVLQLDNFRRLQGFGWPGFGKINLWRQDKGQKACAAAFVQAIQAGGPAPIPFEELIEVSRVTIELAG